AGAGVGQRNRRARGADSQIIHACTIDGGSDVGGKGGAGGSGIVGAGYGCDGNGGPIDVNIKSIESVVGGSDREGGDVDFGRARYRSAICADGRDASGRSSGRGLVPVAERTDVGVGDLGDIDDLALASAHPEGHVGESVLPQAL